MANYDISLSSTGGKIVVTADGWQKFSYAGPYQYSFDKTNTLLLELGTKNFKIPLANLRVSGAGSAPASVAAALTALDAVFTSPVGAGLSTPYVIAMFVAAYSTTNTIPTGGGANFVAPGNGFSNFNTSEDVREIIIPDGVSGVISNLVITTANAQPASGTAVLTVRKNRVDQAITLTLAINAVAGTYKDTTHSFSVTGGDKLSIKGICNASAASAQIVSISLLFKNR